MPVAMSELAADLAAETAELRRLVAGLDEHGWRLPTPAEGWSIADQFSHLAFFDDAAIKSATDPDGFTAELDQMLGVAGVAPGDGSTAAGPLAPDDIAARYRSMAGADVLSWFDASRRRLIEVFAALDPAARLPWYGLAMSAASSLTARIMETWAHGQDVADALGGDRPVTARLRHVAHLGVRALPYSFAIRGLDVPAEPVRVELAAPGGETWTWGPADVANRVTGPALDFCLIVTQRRHRGDTAVRAEGDVADRWMDIAQAFAGPPGRGRPPRRPAPTVR